MPEGFWEISYILPLTVSPTPTPPPSIVATSFPIEYLLAIIVVAIAVIAGFFGQKVRKR